MTTQATNKSSFQPSQPVQCGVAVSGLRSAGEHQARVSSAAKKNSKTAGVEAAGHAKLRNYRNFLSVADFGQPG